MTTEKIFYLCILLVGLIAVGVGILLMKGD